MALLLILPILVSGYIFCSGSVYRQATISRYDGQLLYMLIAKTGIFIFLVAALASFVLMYGSKHESFLPLLTAAKQINYFAFLGDEHADYVKFLRAFLFRNGIVEEKQTALWVFLGQASILSFVFAWTSPKLYLLGVMARQRLWPTPAKAFILNLMVPSRPLTSQLLASMNDKTSQYMFSMDDRKVYVGRVSSIGDLHEAGSMDEDFEIVPVMSGYRDKDTLKVTYTTDYSAVVEEMASRGREIGFTIALSQKNIVSISRFEYEIWERFKVRQDEGERGKGGLLERWAALLKAF